MGGRHSSHLKGPPVGVSPRRSYQSSGLNPFHNNLDRNIQLAASRFGVWRRNCDNLSYTTVFSSEPIGKWDTFSVLVCRLAICELRFIIHSSSLNIARYS